MAEERPLFITFEGGEGAGKTTQILHVAAFLNARGRSCLLTREPGGTEIGKKIRALLLDPDHAAMAPLTELLLYMADRAEHIERVIRPALAQGRTVLCDRFFDATVVYQGAARGLSMEWAESLHETVFPGVRPDLTLLLDLPPEVGLSRARRQMEKGGRAAREGRFENEDLSFHRRVREGYLELARRRPGRFRVIDAARGEAEVKEDLLQAVSGFLARPPGEGGR
ncbi:MAG: dTMP kinase [Desulfobacterales bacterium]